MLCDTCLRRWLRASACAHALSWAIGRPFAPARASRRTNTSFWPKGGISFPFFQSVRAVLFETKKAGGKRPGLFVFIGIQILALDEALLDHLLIAEPQIGDIS
jgi:hypothetical protein